MSEPSIWTIPREWEGQTAFIIAGGPSVTQEMVDKLQGRKVVAIKLSCEKAPWADYLFFADGPWFLKYKEIIKTFPGRVVTTSPLQDSGSKVLKCRKVDVPGLALAPDCLFVRRTSTTGGLNLLFHLGVKRIGLLGCDGKVAPNGDTHHHTPHLLPRRKADPFADQTKDLESLVEPLKSRGVEVFNTNSDSAFRMFPFLDLDAVLAL